jgi:hypothetical protein
LSAIDKATLGGLARKRSLSDMAMARGVPTHTVRRQISDLQMKLEAANSDELIQRAITLGLVSAVIRLSASTLPMS